MVFSFANINRILKMTNCTNLALLTQAWVVVALWSPWVFFFTKQSLRKNKMSHTWWWLAISFIQELKHRKNCKSYPVCMAGQTWISVMKSLSLWKKVAVHLFSKYEKFCKESQSWQLSVFQIISDFLVRLEVIHELVGGCLISKLSLTSSWRLDVRK